MKQCSHWVAITMLVMCACSDKGSAGKSESDSGGASTHDESHAGSGAMNSTATGIITGMADSTVTSSDVPTTLTVTGPVTGGMGKPFTASALDLPSRGYSEKEFFFEGGATSYTQMGDQTMDGKWTLMENTKARFKSRLLVRRPMDEKKFNGTVVVEWLNVSGGADGDPGFMYNAEEILREGYAYVGVSAQQVGVEGGGLSLGAGPGGILPLKQQDPDRYGSLTHPGDDYSFDIFSQAGQVIKDSSKGDVLEGLKPQRLIAYGESQSAMRMASYVDGVHPLAKVYDGFFIHSRGASGLPFNTSGSIASLAGFGFGGGGGGGVHIRDDIDAKVFQFQTETDVTGMLAFLPARQPDTDKLRTWEVAGTSHADQYIVDFNKSLANQNAVMCDGANNGPQPYVIRAALHWLNEWMTNGKEPPTGEVLETNSDGSTKTDDNGNALGGVRSSDVDVPISTLSGQPSQATSGNFWCILFGSTTPFTADKLMSLYPSHDDYVNKVKDDNKNLVKAGFLLEPEEKFLADRAQDAAIPN